MKKTMPLLNQYNCLLTLLIGTKNSNVFAFLSNMHPILKNKCAKFQLKIFNRFCTIVINFCKFVCHFISVMTACDNWHFYAYL